MDIPLIPINWHKLTEQISLLKEFEHRKNQTFIVILSYEMSEKQEIDGYSMIPIDFHLRDTILKCDTYIEYNHITDPDKKRVKNLNVIRYRFIDKVLDVNNNLLIFADEYEYEMGKAMSMSFIKKMDDKAKEGIFYNALTFREEKDITDE